MMTIAVRRWQRDQSLADLRAARICSILTSTKDAPHPPREFMIDYETGDAPKEQKRRQTPAEMAAILRAIAIQNGGTVQ
jgi:hypothetical protein